MATHSNGLIMDMADGLVMDMASQRIKMLWQG